MLKKLLYIVFVLLSWSVTAQRKYEAFDVINESLIVPPNGIFLSDNIFMDDSEVMNSHYLEYLHFLAQDSSDEAIIKAYPDTAIFGKRHLNDFLKIRKEYYKKQGKKRKPVSLLFHDELVHPPSSKHHWYNYFSYRETRHFPVVGIDYQQAVSYCKWRSDFVSNYFNDVLKKKSKYKAFKDKVVRFEFFLPTEAEWESAAFANGDPRNSHFGLNEAPADSSVYFNIKFTDNQKYKNKIQPEYIYSHTPNSSGFYNLIGNVSEITVIKGISKGGGFIHTAVQCNPKNHISYSKPQKWLGFRCVCKVLVTPIQN
ncbi:MAG: SUMF1/EgtB/PvdO family nonheme iron enzyme [Opitutaceae bacterium]|nr:SUMF1/EgtB/PvdO family nonheme iron enzyme [Cytophagales bacterium]